MAGLLRSTNGRISFYSEGAIEEGVDYPESIGFTSLKTIKKWSQYHIVIDGVNEGQVFAVKTQKKGNYCRVAQK